MSKKAKVYKSGDFIFAKVKGYPAWPARVQKQNGKKYLVYFYGTGETANLPPNQIFDYEENKEKLLSKSVKRKDFNDGVRQIAYDFSNNIPLDQVIGAIEVVAMETDPDAAAADATANSTMETSVADSTVADESIVDDPNASIVSEPPVEDSDEGLLVIDEGKKKKPGRPSAKDTPKAAKEPKTPKGKAKKDEKEDKEEAKPEEEIVSRSGRKIRPKRYADEQTEDNATLPSPVAKKRRADDVTEKEKEKEKEKSKPEVTADKISNKQYNAVSQAELEDIKEPFKGEDADKENLLITHLPTGEYVGIKLFQSRPATFKNEAAQVQWERLAAKNALVLKGQLEKGHITPQSVAAQLETDLCLTDDEKANLTKEREIEEKKSRVQFLKTEMRLIEIDAKVKACLSVDKADTDECLKLLDELAELDLKPLMLTKHPRCVESVRRMRSYVGNSPQWQLSEQAAAGFSKQAACIRRRAQAVYCTMRSLFATPEGLSFSEFFAERVAQFKRCTDALSESEKLELVHEPLGMSVPTSHTMRAAIDAANEMEAEEKEKEKEEESEPEPKRKRATPVKAKKAPAVNTPAKTPSKRQSSRNKPEEVKETPIEAPETADPPAEKPVLNGEAKKELPTRKRGRKQEPAKEKEADKPVETPDEEQNEPTETTDETSEVKDSENVEAEKDGSEETDKASEPPAVSEVENSASDEAPKEADNAEPVKESETKVDETNEPAATEQIDDQEKESKESAEKDANAEKETSDSAEKAATEATETSEEKTDTTESKEKANSDAKKESNSKAKEANGKAKETNNKAKEPNDKAKESNDPKGKDREEKAKESKGKRSNEEKDEEVEPRAKRSRECTKKTEPVTPKSPGKRKTRS